MKMQILCYLLWLGIEAIVKFSTFDYIHRTFPSRVHSRASTFLAAGALRILFLESVTTGRPDQAQGPCRDLAVPKIGVYVGRFTAEHGVTSRPKRGSICHQVV